MLRAADAGAVPSAEWLSDVHNPELLQLSAAAQAWKTSAT